MWFWQLQRHMPMLHLSFKAGHSTVMSSLAMKEVSNYYWNRHSKVYVALIDASKAFSRIRYDHIFYLLYKRSILPIYTYCDHLLKAPQTRTQELQIICISQWSIVLMLNMTTNARSFQLFEQFIHINGEYQWRNDSSLTHTINATKLIAIYMLPRSSTFLPLINVHNCSQYNGWYTSLVK